MYIFAFFFSFHKDYKNKYNVTMSNDLNDYQITRNLVIFFIVIAAITAILAGLGMYIQESDFRANLEEETREALDD